MAEWVYYNPNPRGRRTGDCVIRAICAATGQDWETVYTGVALAGMAMGDMPSSNHVWRAYLKSLGFRRREAPDTCPDCYTAGDFADEHPNGVYILSTGSHAVASVFGKLYDTWDSRGESIESYFYKEGDPYAKLYADV